MIEFLTPAEPMTKEVAVEIINITAIVNLFQLIGRNTIQYVI